MINVKNLERDKVDLETLSKMSDSELLDYIEGDALILCALNRYRYSINDDLLIEFSLPKGTLSAGNQSLYCDDDAISLFDDVDMTPYRIAAINKLRSELKMFSNDKRLQDSTDVPETEEL